MALEGNWVTEEHTGIGSAFSFRIRQKLHEEQTPYQKIEIFETESFGRESLLVLVVVGPFLFSFFCFGRLLLVLLAVVTVAPCGRYSSTRILSWPSRWISMNG